MRAQQRMHGVAYASRVGVHHPKPKSNAIAPDVEVFRYMLAWVAIIFFVSLSHFRASRVTNFNVNVSDEAIVITSLDTPVGNPSYKQEDGSKPNAKYEESNPSSTKILKASTTMTAKAEANSVASADQRLTEEFPRSVTPKIEPNKSQEEGRSTTSSIKIKSRRRRSTRKSPSRTQSNMARHEHELAPLRVRRKSKRHRHNSAAAIELTKIDSAIPKTP